MAKPDSQILGKTPQGFTEVLSGEALAFVADLQRKFNPTREKLLQLRAERQERLNRGELPDFLKETLEVRNSNWTIAELPKNLLDRRVEITGPAEAKMMINALNSGAQSFMADLEDSLSPTFENVVQAQLHLKEAVRGGLTYTNPEGKKYSLHSKRALLFVRPRGWHLPEKHFTVDGKVVSASLFDFGLYFFHNARENSSPYFYLPKMESHLEARLWNDVFNFAEDSFKLPRGRIRATVLIETIFASFEMDEILFELKEHSAGLNAGRWDYLFSIIKKFRNQERFQFPDRSQLTMTIPFMKSYAELLVKTCHRRGAPAMGGMAAFVPSRKDPKINEIAFQKVREDKSREAHQGFDGTWVAHPDLVPIALQEFDRILGGRPNQISKQREDVKVAAKDLLHFQIESGKITEAGLRNNISVALQYLHYWLNGVGAAAIYNLMEDAATAEISRAQLWQWAHRKSVLDDGRAISPELYKTFRQEEAEKLGLTSQMTVELLDGLVLNKDFSDFLTVPAYHYL